MAFIGFIKKNSNVSLFAKIDSNDFTHTIKLFIRKSVKIILTFIRKNV